MGALFHYIPMTVGEIMDHRRITREEIDRLPSALHRMVAWELVKRGEYILDEPGEPGQVPGEA